MAAVTKTGKHLHLQPSMIDLVSYLTSVVRNNYNNVSLDANTCKDANHERGSMSAVGTTLVLRASTT